MSVTPEELAAYVDGELTGVAADRIAQAIAADPQLAARVEAEQRMRATLKRALDPVLAEPVPEDLTLMIAAFAAAEAEDDMTDAPVIATAKSSPAPVVDLAAARARHERQHPALPARRWTKRWGIGAAIAASLVLGLAVGPQLLSRGPVRDQGGTLVASGTLARGLEIRLAADGPGGQSLKILASFQKDDGDFCRIFEAEKTSGIACKQDGAWRLERTVATGTRQETDYRQAGSAQAELLNAAQAMAKGDPLDAERERAARANGWTK